MQRLYSITLSPSAGHTLEIRTVAASPAADVGIPLTVSGFVGAVFEAEPFTEPTPPLCFFQDPDGLFEPLRLRENADYEFVVTLPANKEEAARRWRDAGGPGSSWPFSSPRLAASLKLYPPRFWQEETKDRIYTSIGGMLNFGSHVGTVELSLDALRPLYAEVACSKIRYFDDFATLLREVAKDFVELLFEVDNVTGLHFEGGEPDDVLPAVQLFHLRRIMAYDGLPLALDTILRSPHTKLIQTTELVDAAKATRIDAVDVIRHAPNLSYREGGPAAALFRGYSPTHLPLTERHDVIDTPENRYVKSFLQELSNTLQKLQFLLEREKKQASVREVQQWQHSVDEWLSWIGWREVGPLSYMPSNSQVLQRRVGYREVLEADIALQYSLQLPWNRGLEIASASGDLRPIFELYEYWCFFALRKALEMLCGPDTKDIGDFYIRHENRLHVNLRRGTKSRLKFVYNYGDNSANVSLFYNRTFNQGQLKVDFSDGSYSTIFKPDYSVLIEFQEVRHWLHFDAKYRLNMNEWQRQVNDVAFEEAEQVENQEVGELFQRSDLYKMHTYRDALLGSRGAYVLFPGTGKETKFVRHPDNAYRASFQIPSVGAFPLRPQASEEQVRIISIFFEDVFQTIMQGNPYHNETAFA